MVVVALAALAISTVTSPERIRGEKWLMGTFTFAFFGLLFALWGIAGIPCRRSRPAIHLGVLWCLMAHLMLMSLVILGLIIPQGAALVLLLVVYLTTWR